MEGINIAKHVQQLLPLWSNVPAENIKVQRMVGITNETFKVSAGAEGPPPLIYRRFGESSQSSPPTTQTLSC